jgi:hypothetical protein
MAGTQCPSCGVGTLAGTANDISCPRCGYRRTVSGGSVEVNVPLAEAMVNPRMEIEGARDRGDYFAAFALSTTYFEAYASIVLQKSLKNQVGKDRLERLSVSEIAAILYGIGAIDQATYQKILEVTKQRNQLVHPDDIALRYKLDTGPTDKLLEKAIEAIEELREKAGLHKTLSAE